MAVLLLAEVWRVFDLAQELEAYKEAADHLCQELALVDRLVIDLSGHSTRPQIRAVLAERYREAVI
jgi:hypothetical protein